MDRYTQVSVKCGPPDLWIISGLSADQNVRGSPGVCPHPLFSDPNPNPYPNPKHWVGTNSGAPMCGPFQQTSE